MICRMCLMDSLEVLDIFAGGTTAASNIAATIAKHFWFEPKDDDQMSNVVCAACWRKIKFFHEYYLSVEEAQRILSEGLAVNQKRKEQESLEQHADAGIREFVQIEAKESDKENDSDVDGDVITIIELADEKMSEEDGTCVESVSSTRIMQRNIIAINNENQENFLNEELRLDSSKESREFVQVKSEESDEEKESDEDGGVITVIELAHEKMSEENDNNEYRGNFLNEELRLESSKESRFYEDMIEEVKSYLFDEIPERSLTGSRNEDYIIKIEPTDPTSDSNVVNVESDDGNYSSLLSMRRYPNEPRSTDQTQGKESRLGDNYVATEEEALKIGRHVDVASELSGGIKQFLKFELEDSNEGNYASLGDGCAIKVMEYAAEHKLEQDCALDNEAIVYNYFIKEVALESTKPIGVDEGLIEEVKASLYDDIPEQIIIRDPEVQTNLDDDAPLESLRLGQIEVGTTHLTNKPKRISFQQYKEDDLKIARHIELKFDLCGGGLARFAEILRHVNENYGKLCYVKCCKRKLIQKSEVLDHLHKHFDSHYFKCSKCNKSYRHKQDLKNHLSRHEMLETQMHCANCFKWFTNQYLMKQHICPSLIAKEPCFSCEICWKSFASKTLLEMHRKYVHEPKQCLSCEKVIEGETLFAEHQREHSDVVDPKVQCEKCGIWLKNRVRLKFHTKNAHLDGKSVKRREFTCKICGKMSISNTGLKAHMRNMHAPQLKFACRVCGKGFKWVRNLKKHVARHTGELPYTCPYCPRSFKYTSTMYGHRRTTHRKEWEESRRIREQEKMKNEHICNICGKTSISKDGLKFHMKSVHKAQRQFACSLCGKGFKKRLYLKEHMAYHTGEYLYRCTYCPQSFRNSGSMYGHRKKAHRQEWEERRKMRALPANQKSKVIQNIASKETKINPNLS